MNVQVVLKTELLYTYILLLLLLLLLLVNLSL